MGPYQSISPIKIYSIDSIELNVSTLAYDLKDNDEGFLHVIEGAYMYCDLIVDGKLFVTEQQLEEILSIEPLSIRMIKDSIIYINSFSSIARMEFNSLGKVVEVFHIENIENDLDDDVFYFQMLD